MGPCGPGTVVLCHHWLLRRALGRRGDGAVSRLPAILAVGSQDKSTVQIWNVSTGKEVRRLGQNISTDANWFVDYLTFSPDGAILVSKRTFYPGDVNGIDPRLPSEMYFWDLKTGKEQDRFSKFKNWCDWVSFSPDGKTMVTTAKRSDYHLTLWEASTGNELRRVGNEKRFLTAVFTPDSRHVATGMEDGSTILWEVPTGKLLRNLSGHRGPVNHLAFSDDGRLLVSESSDGTALVWDLHDLVSHERTKPP